MPPLIAGLIGCALGVVAAAAVAAVIVDRHGRRVRAAERRAKGAERMAEIGAMTGGLAHEIKNPLSTLGLNAQLLQESLEELAIDETERDRLLRRLDGLRRESDRLRGILTDFLEFAGEIRLQTEEADLNTVVSELADFFLPQAEQHGVRLRTDLGDALPSLRLDVGHVKQAVLNLMLNATQAMAGQDSPKELFLKTDALREPGGAESVRVHVIDTGPGIDAERAAQVFNPYFTTKSGGSGLGLPTSRRLVEAHGGHVDLFTEPGSGTSFVLSFPVQSNAN
jgi:signal transduction histidine kinase